MKNYSINLILLALLFAGVVAHAEPGCTEPSQNETRFGSCIKAWAPLAQTDVVTDATYAHLYGGEHFLKCQGEQEGGLKRRLEYVGNEFNLVIKIKVGEALDNGDVNIVGNVFTTYFE